MKKALSFLFFTPFILQASDPCYNIQLSDQIFLCSKRTFEHNDDKLNEIYKSILSTIRKEYAPDPDMGSEFVQKIKLSQRAWINFRDANCTVFSFQIDKESQAFETSMYSCKNDMTLKRIEELKSVLINN
ncbi:Uncharacterized protein conserved in bacteria [Salmonella enterica subsp. indica]|uniref:DUF1311 domain-containing protein n=3 Tax=Salmonella enterica TaxID=28901 RepID=A0A701ZHW2_SALER|nr:lysozyme inhibitor LprI family protein [Salmonella enterica]EBH9038137.1 DUF1311 domain-containing protein [Salmonella enterica subsp. indica serovar 11:b:e,n,x]EBP3213772.1 DUF1311 domain-containing protein [Salmonella enterica subsp. arizonae]ECI8274117.1 DUF1311 domain-containing protein [Salmonella enterica subsp. enterica]EDR2773658.1 DUF1311 domain-containing protein [Salmonella enterica subsp. enterica serovar Oslo]EEC4251081.1 DUF1311 domain-containing protein [Salmonella enterica s